MDRIIEIVDGIVSQMRYEAISAACSGDAPDDDPIPVRLPVPGDEDFES